jgi:hypothetical protein
MSATDQYLYRGGVGHGVPKIRGLAMSFGGRIEGVPVRNALGGSNGFRRPGYAISIDPGLLYGSRSVHVLRQPALGRPAQSQAQRLRLPKRDSWGHGIRRLRSAG